MNDWDKLIESKKKVILKELKNLQKIQDCVDSVNITKQAVKSHNREHLLYRLRVC